jgi:predicted dehydrogenase
VRIGVLGLGFMGSTHLQGILRIPGLELAAVMDADPKRRSGDLSGIQGNLGGPGQQLDLAGVARYGTVAEILADSSVEAVDICLPTNSHAPAAIEALRAGKHVLVEKPMALDDGSSALILAEAARAGRVLMVAQVLRFFPAYRALYDLVRSERLGAVRSALFRRRTAAPTWGPWEFDKTMSGGGVFDLLIHDVDQALWLFGAPEAISATGHEDLPRGIDTIAAELHYPNIGSVTITGGWHHRGQYPFSMEYTVVGDEGVVEFSSAGRPATVYWADGRSEVLPVDDKDPYQAEIEYFAECCRKGARPERCLPEESAFAVRLTRRMVEARSSRQRQTP